MAGVSLYAMALTPTADSVLLARFNRSDGQVYTCQRALTNAEGKRQFITRSFPAATSTGKLRMVRRGQHVVLSVADDPAGTFRDLHQFDFCSEDLHLVRVAADNGSSDNVVDVRIRDLEVGEDSAALPGSLDGRATPPRRWWLYSAGGMVALLLGGGGLALWLRARQGRVRQPPGATMDRNR